MGQWLPLQSSGLDSFSSAGGGVSIPGWGAKRSHMSHGQKHQNIKQKQYYNKLKTLKMVHIQKNKS